MNDSLQRHIGIPLTETLLNSDLLISISLLMCFVTLLLLKQRNSIFYASLQSIFSGELFFTGKITIGDQVQQYFLLLISLFGISMLGAYSLPNTPFSWTLIGSLFTALSAFILVKVLIMQAYFRLLFTTRIQTFMYRYISLTIVVGMACFFAFILLVYAPVIPPAIIYVLLGIVLCVYILSVFYILFKHFFCRVGLIFHFILYLCTLEILPVLFFIKWAVQ